MEAGKLRDRVSFQRRDEVPDDMGNVKQGLAPFGAPVWGDMRETPGKERVAAGRVEASRTATLRIRDSTFARSLLASDVATVRGQDWDIVSVSRLGNQNETIELLLQTGSGV